MACKDMNRFPHEIRDDMVIAIAQAKPQAISMQDADGDTPLHSALKYGASNRVLKDLIELDYGYYEKEAHTDYNMNHQDGGSNGSSFAKGDFEQYDLPIHIAISYEASLSIIKLLIDAYPEGALALNGKGQTPLHIACECGRLDVCEEIGKSHTVNLGSTLPMLLSTKDGWGMTPLSLLWDQYTDVASNHKESVGGPYRQDRAHDDDDESGDEGDEVDDGKYERMLEVLKCIQTLTLTAVSNCSCESCQRVSINRAVQDTCNALETTRPGSKNEGWFFTFDETYELLNAAISLGEEIVPEGFVSLLLANQPAALYCFDIKGHFLLHKAAMVNRKSNEHHESLSAFHLEQEGANFEATIDKDHLLIKKDYKMFPSRSSESSHLSSTNVRSNVTMILEQNPQAAQVKDIQGQLPLHLATNAGIGWNRGLKELLTASPPDVLELPDEATGMYPFMLAAVSGYKKKKDSKISSLDNVFCLLSSCPHLAASSFIDFENSGRSADTIHKRATYNEDLNSCPNKRRKSS